MLPAVERVFKVLRRDLGNGDTAADVMHRGNMATPLASTISGKLGWQVRRAGLPTCPGAESMWGTRRQDGVVDSGDTSKRNALLSSWMPLTLATSRLPQGSCHAYCRPLRQVGSNRRWTCVPSPPRLVKPRQQLRHLVRPWVSLGLSMRCSKKASLRRPSPCLAVLMP